MRPNIKFSLTKKIKGKNNIFIISGVLAYSFFLIGISAFAAKNGYFGRIVTPILKSNLELPLIYLKSQLLRSNPLVLDIKHKNIVKINETRNNALKKGFLVPKENDWVNGKGSRNDKEIDFKIRLKGQYDPHWGKLSNGNWSYKIKLKGDNTIFGMKRFALQHPARREYMSEWYFHKLSRYSGMISPRYFFTPLVINGKKYPVYAVEENFDKHLIENNNRREGPIFMLQEKKDISNQLNFYPTISFYQEKKYKSNPRGRELLRKVEYLVNGFFSGELNASQVFDIKQMARAIAHADLLGNFHFLHTQNIRFYLNTVTGLIEPIPFDNGEIKYNNTPLLGENYYHSAKKENILSVDFDEITKNNNSLGQQKIRTNAIFFDQVSYLGGKDFINRLFLDKKFSKEYIKSLKIISNKEWLDEFFLSIKESENKNLTLLRRNFPWYRFKKDKLYKNQVYIKSKLEPPSVLKAFLINKKDGFIEANVANVHSLPIEITGIVNSEGLKIAEFNPIYLKNRKFICQSVECNYKEPTNPDYEKLKFNLANIKSEALSSKGLKFISRIVGTKSLVLDPIYTADEIKIYENKDLKLTNHPYLELDKNENFYSFKKGNITINKKIFIPKGFALKVFPGTNIDLKNNSAIISFSNVQIMGTKERPIFITSSDNSGSGIAILGAEKNSNINNAYFRNLKSLESGGLRLTGALTTYESEINIKNITFEDNKSEDAFNCIRSKAKLQNVKFNNIFSDAIDFDFCQGSLRDLYFSDIGNDGLDFSGSTVNVNDVKMSNIGDKGISVGERSYVDLNNITINSSNMAIAGKDSSVIKGADINIFNSNIGVAGYQKKSEYGPSEILLNKVNINNSSYNYLSEINSRIIINNNLIKNNIKNLYKSLY